jgi:hypothetical protein
MSESTPRDTQFASFAPLQLSELESLVAENVVSCPRCGGKDFEERECGRDTWDSVGWTADVCLGCALWYSNWLGKWLIDCESCSDEDDAEEFVSEPVEPF